MPGYDQAESDAVEALDGGMDINESPEAAEETSSQEEVATEEQPIVEEGAEQELDPAAAQPSADDFDSAAWTLKFRGRDVVPRDRQHLVNLAQQGYLYSQRAQELKTREEQLNQQSTKYEQYQKLAEAFQANPDLQKKIMGLYNESMTGQQQQPGQPDPTQAFQPYVQKIDQLEQRLRSYDDRQADKELQSEIKGLKDKYPDSQWDIPNEAGRTFEWEVLNHAHQNNFKTLEQAYRDMMWDTVQTRTKANTLKAQAEQQQKLHKQGVVTSKGSQAQAARPMPNVREMNYDQIAAQVMEGNLK